MHQSRLNSLCKGMDRTADMGPFPHDTAADSLYDFDATKMMGVVDGDDDDTVRDQAMWELIYRETPENRTKELPDLLVTVAREGKQPVLRRSASWGLLKLGEVDLLAMCPVKDDDGNTQSWKQNLIYESKGRTDYVDPRPVRVVESELGYAMTLPLTIHGLVQFRHYRYDADPSGAPYSVIEAGKGLASRSTVGREQVDPDLVVSNQTAKEVSSSSGRSDPRAFDWYSFATGPIAQQRLVGALTAATGLGSFYENLTIQKVVTDPLGDGLDHVQGYLFQGMSRSISSNAMAHYYTSSGPQPFYLSGRIGDASEGVIFVDTQLSRHAETHIVSNKNVPYPYVQSVRGLFFGPAHMNPAIVANPDMPLDNLLQIVKDPYANGWFFGEFRSAVVDVDGDGAIEVNGMEMFTDLAGDVVERSPQGPQPSLAFAR